MHPVLSVSMWTTLYWNMGEDQTSYHTDATMQDIPLSLLFCMINPVLTCMSIVTLPSMCRHSSFSPTVAPAYHILRKGYWFHESHPVSCGFRVSNQCRDQGIIFQSILVDWAAKMQCLRNPSYPLPFEERVPFGCYGVQKSFPSFAVLQFSLSFKPSQARFLCSQEAHMISWRDCRRE